MKKQKFNTFAIGTLIGLIMPACGNKDKNTKQETEQKNIQEISLLTDTIGFFGGIENTMMKAEILKAGKIIADSYIDILSNRLKVYNVSLNKELMKKYFHDPEVIMFGKSGFTTIEIYGEHHIINKLIVGIIESLDLDSKNYGKARKEEITAVVYNTVHEMYQKMYLNHKYKERKHRTIFSGKDCKSK